MVLSNVLQTDPPGCVAINFDKTIAEIEAAVHFSYTNMLIQNDEWRFLGECNVSAEHTTLQAEISFQNLLKINK